MSPWCNDSVPAGLPLSPLSFSPAPGALCLRTWLIQTPGTGHPHAKPPFNQSSSFEREGERKKGGRCTVWSLDERCSWRTGAAITYGPTHTPRIHRNSVPRCHAACQIKGSLSRKEPGSVWCISTGCNTTTAVESCHSWTAGKTRLSFISSLIHLLRPILSGLMYAHPSPVAAQHARDRDGAQQRNQERGSRAVTARQREGGKRRWRGEAGRSLGGGGRKTCKPLPMDGA